MLNSHRKFIDDTVELVKKEMVLLHEVDKPGSDIEEFIDSLDAILAHKEDMIGRLRGKLAGFRTNIQEEQRLSKKFYQAQGN